MEIPANKVSYEEERHKPMPRCNYSIIQSKLITALSNQYEMRYDIFSELTLLLGTWEAVPDISIFAKKHINYERDELRLNFISYAELARSFK